MKAKKLIKAGLRYIASPDYRFLIQAGFGKYDSMPDAEYLKRKFKACIGKELNLEEPRTFNEKLQWLKLYDRKPEYTVMVDKYRVREYIADQIGEQYLIPMLGVWDDPEEIDFDALPDRFVLKCNHNSGVGMYICTDKSKMDIPKVKRELRRGLEQDYYLTGREWPYKDVPRRIVAEQFISDSSGDLPDYKFMCFDGEVKCSFVCSERFSGKGLHVTFFDREWNVMPVQRHYPSVKEGLPKPKQYAQMVALAEKLSRGLPFVRVDFYEVDEKIYFGELTFYPGSGFEEFTPEEWDYTLGSWTKLPEINTNS